MTSQKRKHMNSWPVQDAKARFSELLDICLREGPQVVTRRGERQAVLVPLAEWERLTSSRFPTVKDWLLTDFARGDLNIPPRKKLRRRKPPTF
jgi:antitoxin Phd